MHHQDNGGGTAPQGFFDPAIRAAAEIMQLTGCDLLLLPRIAGLIRTALRDEREPRQARDRGTCQIISLFKSFHSFPHPRENRREMPAHHRGNENVTRTYSTE
jgi:hypothetical protein